MASIASQAILHPTVSKSIKYASTTTGRDKAYRAVQYFARFYVWHLISRGDKDGAVRWNALKSHLALARKLMRLGKPLENLQAAVRAILSTGSPLEQITTIARQLSYFGYLTFDAVAWAQTVKFVTLQPETASKVTRIINRFWAAGILFSIVNGVAKSVRLANEAERLRHSSEADLSEKAGLETRISTISTARKQARRQLTIDLLDIWIPTTGLGFFNINDGVLGIFGLITSLIAAEQQWTSVNGK